MFNNYLPLLLPSDEATSDSKTWMYIQSDYGQNVLDFVGSKVTVEQFTAGHTKKGFNGKYLLSLQEKLLSSGAGMMTKSWKTKRLASSGTWATLNGSERAST